MRRRYEAGDSGIGSRIAAVGAALMLLFGVAAFGLGGSSAGAINYAATFASWSNNGQVTSGTIGSASISIVQPIDWGITTGDLSGADFNPPGTATQAVTSFDTNATTTFNFSSPVSNPALYFNYMRGGSATAGPTTVALSATGGTCQWSIQSGFSGSTLVGSTFTPDTTWYSFGVLLCTGTVSSITLTPTTTQSIGVADITIASLVDLTPTTTSTSAPSTTAVPTTASDPSAVTPAFAG